MATTKAHDLARLLADGVVGTTEIGDSQVTTAKIADASITTDKLATNAVTAAKVDIDAADVPYDNTTSGISANTLQEAIDYLNIATGGGSAGAQATYTRDAFTATAGQTTFTTSNGYTLGYVQVFMNGVMLALTDYTANDESTVVLSTGARAGDEIVVIAYDSFAISEVLRTLNISASFPDDGITLNSGGDLLIGATLVSSPGDVHARLRASGQLTANSDGNAALFVGRNTSDGDIAVFRKDGSAVGSIGTQNGQPYFAHDNGSTDVGILLGNSGTTARAIIPCRQGGSIPDGAIDIGYSSGRWRDLYLSGGVSFDGGSNFLDAYEEGTWSPTVSEGSLSSANCHYMRVGSLVYCQFDITLTGSSTGENTRFGGIPFQGERDYFSGTVGWHEVSRPVQIHGSSSAWYLMDNTGPTTKHLTYSEAVNKRFLGSFFYLTTL